MLKKDEFQMIAFAGDEEFERWLAKEVEEEGRDAKRACRKMIKDCKLTRVFELRRQDATNLHEDEESQVIVRRVIGEAHHSADMFGDGSKIKTENKNFSVVGKSEGETEKFAVQLQKAFRKFKMLELEMRGTDISEHEILEIQKLYEEAELDIYARSNLGFLELVEKNGCSICMEAQDERQESYIVLYREGITNEPEWGGYGFTAIISYVIML